MTVVAGDGSAVLVYVIEEEKKMRFDHQLVGGVALLPVFQHGQNTGGYSLVQARADGIKIFHSPFVIQKREDVFVLAGIIFCPLKERGMKQDIKIFPACEIALLYRVDSVGQNDDEVACAERVRLSP